MALHDPPLTGVTLALAAKLSQASVSRLLAGQEPSVAHVGCFCAVISEERERRVELLLAHLRDVVAGAHTAGIDERHVVLASANESQAGTASLGADLQLLAEECAQHDDIRALVADLARMVIRHRAELIDATMYAFPGGGVVGAERAPAPAPVESTAGVALAVLLAASLPKPAPRPGF